MLLQVDFNHLWCQDFLLLWLMISRLPPFLVASTVGSLQVFDFFISSEMEQLNLENLFVQYLSKGNRVISRITLPYCFFQGYNLVFNSQFTANFRSVILKRCWSRHKHRYKVQKDSSRSLLVCLIVFKRVDKAQLGSWFDCVHCITAAEIFWPYVTVFEEML